MKIHTRQAIKSTTTFLLAAVMSALTSLTVADDTEIYFSGAGVQAVKPNVLFVLDTSFSMKSKIDVNDDGDTDDAVDISRIDTLHNAMESLISGLDNVRVGIMRMNGAESPSKSGTTLACEYTDQTGTPPGGQTYVSGALDLTNTGNPAKSKAGWSDACYIPTGGAVLFPVEDLDAALSGVTGESGDFRVRAPISASEDDVDQDDPAGSTLVTDTKLIQLATEQCETASVVTKNYRVTSDTDDAGESSTGAFQQGNPLIGKHHTGFRFTNVDIPVGAKIIKSRIIFKVFNKLTGDFNTVIHGDVSNNNNPLTFSAANDITARNASQTTASTDWTGVPTKDVDKNLTTPDMSTILQEIIDMTGASAWASGNAMSFLLDIDSDAANGRDAYDYSHHTGNKRARLNVQYCVPAPDKARVGLRFQDVRVPQGAMVNSAKIIFTAGTPTLNTGTTNAEEMDIYIENVDDSVTFDATNHVDNTTVRPRAVTTTTWAGDEMGTWIEDDSYKSPELKTLVQTVVDRGGWCGGNSMAFHFISRYAGGADDLMRLIQTYDQDPGSAPILQIDYDNTGITGGDTGCTVVDHNLPVTESAHDARQNTGSETVNINQASLGLGDVDGDTYGVLFSLPINQGTTVNSATLQFNMSADSGTTDGEFFVNAQSPNTTGLGGALDFQSSTNNLNNTTDRPRVSSANSGKGIAVTAQPTGQHLIDEKITLDVTSLVQSVVSDTDWAKDDQIALFVTDDNGEARTVFAFDGDAAKAPRLLVNAEENVSNLTVKTVRDRLLELNDTMTVSTLLGWTPSVETLYEAALYWRGKDVDFGKQRGMARIDADGILTGGTETIDYKTKMHRTLTSHPGSWTGGTYNDPATDCQFDTDSSACVQDFISGTPVYTEPTSGGNDCGENYQIFLTDGAPTYTNDSTENKVIAEFSGISSCSVDSAVNAKTARGRCAVEMADDMFTNDQDGDTTNGNQTVKTYTIAFNLNDANGTTWLQQIATAGGGVAYSADTADSLLTVFDDIFGEVLASSTTFASPAITTNFFNRTRSRDEIYFGLFTPELEKKWDGNIKRFRVCVDDDNSDPTSGTTCTTQQVLDSAILDQTGALATNPSTLLFYEDSSDSSGITSHSYWSAAADGNQTSQGGAGAEITDYTARTIYTDETVSGVSSLGTSLATNGHLLNNSNWDNTSSDTPDMTHVRDAVCLDDTLTAAGEECFNKMQWLLGRDILDEDGDNSIDDTRWGFADIIHSSPVVITYGFDDADSDGKLDSGETLYDKLIVNTNDGALRMIEPRSPQATGGTEDWRFMPMSTLATTGQQYDNQQGDHIYGMDNTPVLHITDNNNNGIIEPLTPEFDTVHAYLTMRRGGGYLYSVDLTPTAAVSGYPFTITPKYRWRIQAGTTGFERMGDTWSRPVITTIKVRDSGGSVVDKEVLIMGGGYDNDLDNNFGTTNANPNLGNVIYIIDPADGTLLLSISGSGTTSGANIQIADLNHSIVSSISTLDSDDDTVTDRLYFSDTGGNVWRVDLGDDINDDGTGLYSTPTYDTVVGHLASLSTSGTAAAERRFFNEMATVRVIDNIYTDTTTHTDNALGKLTYVVLTSGYRAHPLDTAVTDKYYALRDKFINRMPDGDSDHKADGSTWGSPITDSTTDLGDATSAALSGSAGANDATAKRGYYVDFPDTGEKGLSSVVILFGQVFFTTYVPDSGVSSTCSANLGNAFGYALSLASGDGVIDWDLDNDTDIADRRHTLGAGMSSDPIPIFTDQGVKIIAGLQQSIQALSDTNTNSIVRTYWYEDTP